MITPSEENTVKVKKVVQQAWVVINSSSDWLPKLLRHLIREGALTAAAVVAAREHPNPFQSQHSFLVQLSKDSEISEEVSDLLQSLLQRGDVLEAHSYNYNWAEVDHVA